jgi:hypothetical protein
MRVRSTMPPSLHCTTTSRKKKEESERKLKGCLGEGEDNVITQFDVLQIFGQLEGLCSAQISENS